MGDEPVTWIAKAKDGWLAAAPLTGTTPSLLDISVNLGDLGVGSYQGSVIITGTTLCTQNSPITVTVTADVVTSTARLSGLALWEPPRHGNGRAAKSARMTRERRLAEIPAVHREQERLAAVEFVLVLELK
jgi:hypothetical protein